jgi:NAD(P)-dependent dehydrogenase (short-subunit alcohol dehydrogenase family)
MELSQVVGIVTGGAAGFGRAFAAKILAAGGRVLITDVDARTLERTADELAAAHNARQRVCFMRQDVTDRESFARAFAYATEFFGVPVNVLVNNAGVGGDASFYNDELSSNWEKVVDIDLTAVVRGTQFALQYMKKALNGREGVIVNLASLAGLNPTPFSPEYGAAKAGVVGLTRSLLETKKTHNVRAFALCPAFADTAMGRIAAEGIPDYIEQTGGLMPVECVTDAFEAALREPDNCGRILRVLKTKASYYRFPGDKLLFPNSKL